MLISVTSATPVASDLGHLLQTPPGRISSIDLGAGRAHVRQEAGEAR